ncbi:MAG: hypothetical protein V3U84_01320 [Thiotrichaceae bacterium]
MESLLPILFLVIILCVIFMGSFLAKIFKAKRFKIHWMVLPWIGALISIVAANVFQLDGLYALAIGLMAFVIVLIFVNGMQLTSAVTIIMTSIASLALLSVGSMYALNQSGTSTRTLTARAIEFIPDSKFYDLSFLAKINETKDTVFIIEDDEVVAGYSEQDLLPNRIVKKYNLKSPIYRVINPSKAGAMRGATVRLLKRDGKLLRGSIVGVEGNKLILGKYVPNKGMIKAPIPLGMIKKLEVMSRTN